MSNAMHNAILVAQAATAPAGQGAATAPAASAAPAAQQAAEAVNQAAPALSQAADAAQQAAAALPPPPLPVPADMGFLHFVAPSDFVGKTLFAILIIMSLVTWYLILVKFVSNLRMRRRSADFLNKFWNSSSLEQVENEIVTHGHGARDPFSHLTSHAMHAQAHHAKFGATK